MDKLEPIRAVFRSAGLYNHAADDLLCERLAEAMTPKTCACESVLCMNECECAVRGKAQSDAAVSAKPVAWVHTWEYPGADSLTESFSWKPADEFLRDTVPAPSSIVSSVPLYAAPPAAAVSDGGFAIVPADALREVIRISDRSHPAWDAVKAAMLAADPAQQPAAAVPAANVTPMRQPRTDLARLVESIKAAVYANGDGLSVTEAIGALELAKLELLKEQEQ